MSAKYKAGDEVVFINSYENFYYKILEITEKKYLYQYYRSDLNEWFTNQNIIDIAYFDAYTMQRTPLTDLFYGWAGSK